MKEQFHIVDRALPPSQDFNILKETALAFIQENSGLEWTNFNPSDPGITILDQVCYALTELGYCIDFPIKDILTKRQGKLRFKNQFFKPKKILTTAPISINDFIKSLLAKVGGIKNASIKLDGTHHLNGVYKTILQFQDSLSENERNEIALAAKLHLNEIRNLNEYFLLPQAFNHLKCKVSGTIILNSVNQLNEFVNRLNEALNQSVFPLPIRKGYQELKSEGYSINEIFNGPELKGGWFVESSLNRKKEKLEPVELISLIHNESQVMNTDKLQISCPEAESHSSRFDQLFYFDIIEDLKQNSLKLIFKGRVLSSESPEITKLHFQKLLSKSLGSIESDLSSKPKIPKGKYRDISNYYSIQNTFPELYPVGKDAVNRNSSKERIAQSRQLKGYLCLFDQVLANQFAQLDAIPKLLSFKNPTCPDFTDRKEYLSTKDEFQRKNLKYPVPFRSFSPSYFFQSLYHVPDVQDLLKDESSNAYFRKSESSLEEKHETWKAFKGNPFNSYIRGLMSCIEDQQTAMERRNDILNHLLSRHGVSPELVDEIINGSSWIGNKNEDQLIVKSLYLQNFAKLNYSKQQAYSYLNADKIQIEINAPSKETLTKLLTETEKDFLVYSEKINRLSKVKKKDLRNYAGLSLKINLLLALRPVYRDYITSKIDQSTLRIKSNYRNKINQAYWLMERKGHILIETNLLYQTCPDAIRAKLVDLPRNALFIILPSYIPYLTEQSFQDRLGLLFQETLPPNITSHILFLDELEMQALIDLFITWHNSIIHKSDSSGIEKEMGQDTVSESWLMLSSILIPKKQQSND